MHEKFSPYQKRTAIVVLGLLALSAVAATQYATVQLGYSFGITGSDSGIRYVGHDLGVDNVILLRADDDQGQNMRLELGDWARGQTVTYTGAFGIVNENQYGINITSVSVDGSGNASIYMWLHNNVDTKATLDSGTLIFNDGAGAQSFYWPLAAGNGNAADANGVATPLNGVSHTRVLTGSDNAAGSDHVWVQIKLVIPQSASTGSYSGTISFTFEESEQPLTITQPNGGEEWEVDASQTIQWSGADETVDNVKLEYSKDNFTSDVHTIISSTPNDGSYLWTVPDDADDSVWVRVSDTTDASRNDTSDASFEITAGDGNLMAYWRFDEGSGTTAYDSTDNDNDGTLEDGAGYSDVAIANTSLNTCTDKDHVEVPDDDTLDIGDGSYSFEVWFQTQYGSEQYLFMKDGAGDAYYYLRQKNGEIKFKLEDTDGTSVDIKKDVDYHDGEWHHVVVVVNRDDNKVYLYIDGSNVVTPKSISSIDTVSNDGQLILGAQTASGSKDWVGYLDEIRFYNRTLSATEIASKHTEWSKSLTIVAPNGGENWDEDINYYITWEAEGDIDYVKLEYSKDDFVSDINTITSSTYNDGSYCWNVPDDLSTTVKVRISDTTDSAMNDVSDGYFAIID